MNFQILLQMFFSFHLGLQRSFIYHMKNKMTYNRGKKDTNPYNISPM